MILGLLMLFGYCFMMWLIFFKLKLAKFGIPQAVIGVFVGVHLLIIFLIGLRFMTPLATEARVIQHTIQLTPRLSHPTRLMAVLVEPNVPVKKGQPLFQFERLSYEYQVKQLEAQLAKAKQNVLVMKTDIEVSRQKVNKNKAHLEFARYQQTLFDKSGEAGRRPRRRCEEMGRPGGS